MSCDYNQLKMLARSCLTRCSTIAEFSQMLQQSIQFCAVQRSTECSAVQIRSEQCSVECSSVMESVESVYVERSGV